jgi:alpha-glucosidase
VSEPQPGSAEPWWKRGILYQIYPRSFADSNGDGTGDLPGIIEHLDYLQWLGVDGIWLSPITVSPNADWGYDVSDYLAVEPDLGTSADIDRLIAEAGRRDIKVLMDLVPNHTSEQHEWFVDARTSREAAHRSWYVWADPKSDGSPPNNWVSSFGGPAWTLDDGTGQYYLHNHLRQQPDLNWWDDDVRQAFDDIMTTWLDRGVAGFRIDVCNMIVKDAQLRDNPPATDTDSFEEQLFGQRSVYNANRPEVHDVIRRWRGLTDGYADRVLVGETPVPEFDALAAYYGSGHDELHLAFNFPFISSPLDAATMSAIVEGIEQALPSGAWPVWTGSNHDMSRFATRWAEGDPAKARAALVMLVCLRGTPVLYQGDEIGQPDTDVPHEQMRDPLGVLYWPAYDGRDAMRTPMQWSPTSGGGFTAPGVEPWLPFGDIGAYNVEDQRDDPGSLLHLTRDLIALRRTSADLRTGSYRALEATPGTWAWSRGDRTLVVVNMADGDGAVEGISGTVCLGSDRGRDGEAVDGTLRLRGWEAVVVERSPTTSGPR